MAKKGFLVSELWTLLLYTKPDYPDHTNPLTLVKEKNEFWTIPTNLQDNLSNKTKKIKKCKVKKKYSTDFVFPNKTARLPNLTKPPELIETQSNYEQEQDVTHAFEPEPDIVVPKP
ncbi:hypothetical protein TNIN_345091 [Trichonephila inaurata madagascariensis]|uniref:Uncharacterized protein n=1 Tax=Trichonephila inaurata madagascariensis TaxID=2747483 RepID=A0A8X6YKE7_9ARAC|nr:hypothetical protein TNIN_345091 [Trichonephila inaurata madagascariensis]